MYYCGRAAGKAKRRVGRALGLAAGFIHGLDENFYRPFLAQLVALQQREAFDAVIVQYVSASKMFEAFDGKVLKVLDTHDAFANRHLINAVAEGYSLTPAAEARGFRRADIVIAIQDTEAEKFRQQLGVEADRVRTVSHLLDLSHRIETPSASAVFLGSKFDANVASLRYVIDAVLPIILQSKPEFELVVAGSVGTAFGASRGVRNIGTVAHPSDAFAAGGIALNPSVKGTGINIKLLDAMAAGVPSVSTALGARGLPVDMQDGVLIAEDDDPAAFAAAVLRLAGNEQLRRELGELAYQNAERWNARQIAALAGIFQPERFTRSIEAADRQFQRQDTTA
jgi:glycosyltransferase involved in cell wall biosynthesis